MRRHLHGIDHCCVLTEDLERSRAVYTRLGFTVSPVGRHPAEMGTGNHTVMLQRDYIELLGVLRPTDFNRDVCGVLAARGEGIAAIAVPTTDAAAAVAEVRAGGLVATEPHEVVRPVTQANGSDVVARFTVAYFPQVAASYARLFCSQAHDPGHTWIPALMAHANTAWAIDYLVVVTDDPSLLAREVAELFDTDPLAVGEGTVAVVTGAAPIIYATPVAVAARYPGVDLSRLAPFGPAALSIKVRDVCVAADCLRRSGVDFVTTPNGLAVRPQDACGVLLVLREAGTDEPADAALVDLGR